MLERRKRNWRSMVRTSVGRRVWAARCWRRGGLGGDDAGEATRRRLRRAEEGVAEAQHGEGDGGVEAVEDERPLAVGGAIARGRGVGNKGRA